MSTTKAIKLQPKGLAFCDFVFKDGLRLGLSEMELYALGKELIEQWDGSETLIQMYQRQHEWPDGFVTDDTVIVE